MGSVLPGFRQKGIATRLAIEQEKWAIENGFLSIKVKTRKKHGAMISFLRTSGFTLVGEIPAIPELETRLLFEKKLNQ